MCFILHSVCMWIECSMSSKSKCSSAFREINWHEIWTWHGIWTLLDLTIHHKRSYTNPVRNTRSSSTDFCSRKWMVDELTLPSKQLLPLSWFLAISNSRVIRRIRKQEISLVQITPETPLREAKNYWWLDLASTCMNLRRVRRIGPGWSGFAKTNLSHYRVKKYFA